MALRSGRLEWRNWKGITHKLTTTLWGKNKVKPVPRVDGLG